MVYIPLDFEENMMQVFHRLLPAMAAQWTWPQSTRVTNVFQFIKPKTIAHAN